jgi:hypothetical protein
MIIYLLTHLPSHAMPLTMLVGSKRALQIMVEREMARVSKEDRAAWLDPLEANKASKTVQTFLTY